MTLNRDEEFFQEASSLLYNWLPEEEKRQLHIELAGEEILSIKELRPDLRFFRLLHFIQVKYVKVEEWIARIFGFVKTINSNNPDFPITDVVLKDANDKNVSLGVLWKALKTVMSEIDFQSFLKQLELQEGFRTYLDSLKMEWLEW